MSDAGCYGGTVYVCVGIEIDREMISDGWKVVVQLFTPRNGGVETRKGI